MRICSIEGCENGHMAKGFCQFHYNSFVYYGNPLKAKRLVKNQQLDWIKCTQYKHSAGYIRLSKSINNICHSKYLHVFVYEQHYGEIPKGYQVHHIDHNPSNNNINNLQLLTPAEHKRLHCGWKLIDGEWWKPCTSCKKLLNVNESFHTNKKRSVNTCKLCSSVSHKNRYLNHKNKIVKVTGIDDGKNIIDGLKIKRGK